MTILSVHYDGSEIEHLSISNSFVCFVAANDPLSVYIAKIGSLLALSCSNTFLECGAALVGTELSKINLLHHFEFGNFVFVIFVCQSYINVRRSQLNDFGEIIYGVTCEFLLEAISCVDADSLSTNVAMTANNLLYLISFEKESKMINLGKHKEDIIFLRFLNSSVIFTSDCTQHCKLWNIKNKTTIDSFTLNDMSTFTTSSRTLRDTLLYGTSKGELFFYPFKEVKAIPEFIAAVPDGGKITQLVESNSSASANREPTRRTWNIEKSNSSSSFTSVAASEVLCLHCFGSKDRAWERLMVVTASAIHIFDQITRSFELTFTMDELNLEYNGYVLSARIYEIENGIEIWLSSNNNRSALLSFNYSMLVQLEGNIANLDSTFNNMQLEEKLSFLAASSMNESNPVGRALCRLSKNPASRLSHLASAKCVGVGQRTTKFPHLPRTAPSINQPVTFGHRIKSSGYATLAPKVVMFKPQVNKLPQKSKSYPKTFQAKLTRSYVGGSQLPSTCKFSGHLESQPTPIYALAYSPSGDRLAVAQGSGCCTIFRSSSFISSCNQTSIPKPTNVLAGHRGAVTDAAWSLDGRFILTCSLDHTARLWSLGNGSGCTLKFIVSYPSGGNANGLGHPILNPAHAQTPAKLGFLDHVQFGQFHLQDSLFHVTCRNKTYFYSYNVDMNVDILHKCHVAASYKLVTTFENESCVRLTAVASTNLFYSYLLVSVGSDRCLNVLDINTGDYVRQIPSVHSATVTGLAINQGSQFSEEDCSSFQSSDVDSGLGGYRLYATVAPGDSVRLWDLRVAKRHVAELARCQPLNGSSGATNGGSVRDFSIPPVSLTFSPCGRHLCFGAMGSVQPYLCPIVFDLRRTENGLAPVYLRALERQTTSNLATVVAWNPLKSEIVSGAVDGRMAIFV